MTLSIALALMGAATGFAAALVLVVRYSQGANHQSRLALAQSASARLRDLEQRAHGGALDAASAEQARIALLNELLAAGWQSQWWPLRGDRGALVVIGLAALAMGCFSLLPFASEGPSPTANISVAAAAPEDPDLARLELYVRSRSPSGATISPSSSPTQQELPDVGTMIERLAARLRSQPEDAEGWRMLGWSYLHTDQAAKAVEAFGRAVALRPQSSELASSYGEALVASEGGTVSVKAVDTFKAALALDAQDARARYYLALAKKQGGQKREALQDWLALQADPLEDEPWVRQLRENTQALALELNVDISIPAAGEAAQPGARELTAQEIRSVQALPLGQQRDLIRGMVEGLAERLQKTPRDEEGWLRLIRSRMVLGEEQAAREALKRALAAFSDDAKAGARIASAARTLGITTSTGNSESIKP